MNRRGSSIDAPQFLGPTLDIPVLTAKRLHNETSAVLDKVAKGKAFRIVRNGKLIGILQPTKVGFAKDWKEIMAEVWAAQKLATGTTANPVLVERGHRRR